MQIPNLMKVSHDDLVFNYLLSMIRDHSKLLLWQNGSSDRAKSKGSLLKINKLTNVLEIESINNDFHFLPNELIYFYGEFRNTIFKAKVLEQSVSRLVVEIPDFFLAEEYRKSSRINFKDSNPNITFDFYININSDSDPICYNRKAFDLSKFGISLKINRAEVGRFFLGDRIVVLLEKNGSTQTWGKIRYISRNCEGNLNNDFYRVGVVWDHEVSLNY
ncbi:MAG: hypothetical protein U0T83_01590 [Bacteriovoracaceae bacterium]